MSVTQIQKARGLSYSSFTEYSACPRKWFYRKVLKYPIDSDASEDTEAFSIGKAFHKALENTKHNLNGFTFSDCISVCAEFDVVEEDTVAMVFSMLTRYKRVHEKTNLKVAACEVTIDLPLFFGVVDAILYDDEAGWWICDLKSAGSLPESTIRSANSHAQLCIYSQYHKEIAAAVGISNIPFLGCRLRITTKSRITRKSGEEIGEYIKRMSAGTRSIDIVVPKEVMNIANISFIHEQTANKILTAKPEDIDSYPCNFGNCFSYFRPCTHYSRCHGKNYTEQPTLEVIEG
jgi:hypothetical protein